MKTKATKKEQARIAERRAMMERELYATRTAAMATMGTLLALLYDGAPPCHLVTATDAVLRSVGALRGAAHLLGMEGPPRRARAA